MLSLAPRHRAFDIFALVLFHFISYHFNDDEDYNDDDDEDDENDDPS